MKKITTASLMIIAIFSLEANALEFKCQTETNQIIIANIGYNRDYVINMFSVDGVDLTKSASYKPARDGYNVMVKSFKNGQDLLAVMWGDNSYYTLGNGKQHSMRCIPTR